MTTPQMNRWKLESLRSLAVLVTALLMGPGCGLVLDLSPPDGQEIVCFVTVDNPEGIAVDISSRDHPDFIGPSISFGGGGGGGPSGGGTRPLRPYFTCPGGACSAACSVADTTAAEADFRRWLNQRITEVASGPASDSPFSVHEGPWCIREVDDGPSTLRCELRESLTEVPICGPTLTAGPLPSCPGGAPTGTCVEVECDGVAPCTDLMYPRLPLGTGEARTVLVRNCGGEDDDFITVAVDGTIAPVEPLADFAIPPDTNGCLPRTPEETRDGRALQLPSVDPLESECSFDVVFEPLTAGSHTADAVFGTSLGPYRLRLTGGANGSRLDDDAPDLLCLDDFVGSCSERRTIRVTNAGLGTVTIDSIFINAAAAGNFRILRPPTPVLRTTLAAGNFVDIEIEWCTGGTDVLTGDLNILSNAEPPFTPIELEFTRATCPPGT